MIAILKHALRCSLALAALGAAGAQAAWPERPITLIVPWGAGGGTDATARIIGSLLERELKQPINVVNRTGGNGVVGHSAIATAPPDGYTIGLATVEIAMMHWQGLTELKYSSYTPIALVNLDPAGFQVRADSPYKNMQDVLAAVKANPGQVQGLRHRPGRHLAPRHRRHAEGPQARSGVGAVGAVERRGARPAGPGRGRRRIRALLAARSALAHRRRQGQEPRHHGIAARRPCTRTCRR